MKTIILSVTVLLFVVRSFSQTTTNSLLSKDYYLQKSRNQKTAAWLLLGGGAALFAAGLAVHTSVDQFDNIYDVFNESKYHGFGARAALMTSGAVAMGGSIHLFTASSRNKNLAMHLAIGSEQTMLPLKNGWAYSIQPAVKLSLPLGIK
ncbi:MAG TPA: hypothetical protein PLA68_06355 [Panacibacter sp.]|nr:hypothetical protein [Panacibacter sp.]